MKKSIGLVGALTLGLGMALAAPTAANAAPKTVDVPTDFVPALSDTRATGHYEVTSTGGLRVWTEGSTGTDKVAEYLASDVPLEEVGSPTLEMTNTAGTIASGYQLVVDFDGDGSPDGILVGEAVYGDNWWLNNAAKQFVKDGAPNIGGGSGSDWFGTLEDWSQAFSEANVVAFGFSLGSGVQGDWTINAINFADDRYTFAVVMNSKDDCKNGGWATSTDPVYRNQGQCVSSFASTKDKLSNFKR